MYATVINDGLGGDKPWHLIIALDDTGEGNKAEFPYLYFIDGQEDLYFEAHRDAQDAKIKLDGFEIELPSNKANDIIPGVAIDLRKAKPGEEFSLAITEDSVAITEKVGKMVESINNVLSFIKTQNNLDETTDTTKTLGGDITLQTIESRLRTVIFQPVKTKYGNMRISDMGISFQRDGLLKFDPKAFENATQNGFDKVSQVIAGHFDVAGGRVNGFVDNL